MNAVTPFTCVDSFLMNLVIKENGFSFIKLY